jgi:hypothetical protein
MLSSSTLGTTVVVVEVVLEVVLVVDVLVLVLVLGPAVVVEVVLAVEEVVLVVGSSVTPTENVALGSTTNTCGSFFKRRTSPASSSATKPFTLLENTSFTSLPSDDSLFTFAATLADSVRMTT